MTVMANSKWAACSRLLGLFCACLLWFGEARSQVLVQLQGAERSTPRPPQEPLQLSWSEEQVAPLWSRLAFELDGMDVTSMVERRPGGAVLALPIPLARGEHQLRVVYSQNDGSLFEWANWTFAVAGIPKLEGEGELMVRLNRRVQNRGDLPRTDGASTQADGVARISARRESDDWTNTLNAQLWFNSEQDANINQNAGDLGEYLLTADNGESQFRLGHHQMPYESLIHSGFLRRGLSVTTALPGDARLSGFAMRSEAITGAYSYTGVQDPMHRVGGLVYESQLMQDAESSYALTLGLVGGEGDDLQASPDIASSQHRGTAGSVGAEASWIGRRLRLRGELARSQYNWNSNGLMPVADSTDQDSAHLVALQYQTEAKAPGSSQWTTELEHREVGSFFRSVAYLGLPTDRRSNRVRTHWRSSEWQAGVGLMRQDTNANALPDLPRISADHADLLLLWSPSYAAQRPWYGHPTVSGTLNEQRQRQTYTPSGYLGTTVDNRSWQSNVSLSLAQESWSGQLGLGTGAFENLTLPDLSTHSNTVSLGGQWRLGDRLSLGPILEWSRLRYVQSGESELVRTGSLFADFAFIPDLFMGNLNFGLNRFNRTVDSQLERNRFFVGELIWRLQKAGENRPGWDARLAVHYQDVDQTLDPGRGGYVQQLFLGLTMTWPVSVRP